MGTVARRVRARSWTLWREFRSRDSGRNVIRDVAVGCFWRRCAWRFCRVVMDLEGVRVV